MITISKKRTYDREYISEFVTGYEVHALTKRGRQDKKRKGEKNIQHQGFAGGHPPNY